VLFFFVGCFVYSKAPPPPMEGVYACLFCIFCCFVCTKILTFFWFPLTAAVASKTHVPVVNTLCANTLQLACETSASDVQLDALALVRLHELATPHSKGDEENSTAATLQQVSATLHQVLTFQDKVVGVWQSCNTILERTHRSPSIDCLRHSCTVGIVWPCQSEKPGQGSQERQTSAHETSAHHASGPSAVGCS